MTKNVRGRCWVFTLNNYTDEQVELLKNSKDYIQYIVWGYEIAPTTNTPHLQGYFECHKKITFNSLKKKIKISSIHIEKRKGSQTQAILYCRKEATEIFEQGEKIEQGSRNDIKALFDMVKKGDEDTEIQEVFPSAYLKYYKGIDRVRKNYIQSKNRENLDIQFDNTTLREWQRNVLELLLNQDDRQVLWIYDEVGNQGKTHLAKYLISKHNAYYVMNGKNQDISYAYEYQPIVIFDYSRSQEDYINYSIIEQFKNGLIFSPKYESVTKLVSKVKVLCLSNFEPDTDKLSYDRWNIITLKPEEYEKKVIKDKGIIKYINNGSKT